jgi:hypothetical protein
LEKHEELTSIKAQLCFLAEYLEAATIKYGEPDQFIEVVVDDAGITQALTAKVHRSTFS